MPTQHGFTRYMLTVDPAFKGQKHVVITRNMTSGEKTRVLEKQTTSLQSQAHDRGPSTESDS